MFCHHCGKEIDDQAAVCIHCGRATENSNLKKENKKMRDVSVFCRYCGKEIDNQAVVCIHCGRATENSNYKKEKKYNAVLDFFMILFTGGLWIIWMIARPKYENE